MGSGWIAAAVFAFTLCSLAIPVTGLAQPASRTDIVFAVDHSLSTLESDPGDQRLRAIEAVAEVARALTDIAEINVGYVAFGSSRFGSARIVHPLRSVRDFTLPSPERLEGTDFVAALCLAWSVVTQRVSASGVCPVAGIPGSSPGASGMTERRVILVTDGVPAPDGPNLRPGPGDTATRCDTASSAAHRYFCDLRNRWSRLNEIAPARLYVIGIDRDDQWFSQTESYWHAVTGCAPPIACQHQVRRAISLGSVRDFIKDFAIGVVACGEGSSAECRVSGGVVRADFLVTGLTDQAIVQLVNPHGQIQAAGGAVTRVRSGAVERWSVSAPPSGAWKVITTSASAAVDLRASLATFDLLAPAQQLSTERVRLSLRASPSTLHRDSFESQDLELRVALEGGPGAGRPVVVRPTRTEDAAVYHLGTLERLAAGTWRAEISIPGVAQALAGTTFVVSDPPSPTPSVAPAPSATVTSVPPPATSTPFPPPATMIPVPTITPVPTSGVPTPTPTPTPSGPRFGEGAWIAFSIIGALLALLIILAASTMQAVEGLRGIRGPIRLRDVAHNQAGIPRALVRGRIVTGPPDWARLITFRRVRVRQSEMRNGRMVETERVFWITLRGLALGPPVARTRPAEPSVPGRGNRWNRARARILAFARECLLGRPLRDLGLNFVRIQRS